MNLFLLRHGLAVERGARGFANDFDRPLTPKGRRQLCQSRAALKKSKPDLILSSPLVRAQQTAEIVAAELKWKKPVRFSDALKPGGKVKKLVAELKRVNPPPENVLLVGHEPDLSGLISRLTTGGDDLRLDFKKGGLAKLEIEKLRPGKCAALAWLLTPKQMKRMR
jgi:phosphohistidine phosphatase